MRKFLYGTLWSLGYLGAYLGLIYLMAEISPLFPRLDNIAGQYLLTALAFLGLLFLIHRKELFRRGWFVAPGKGDSRHALGLAAAGVLLVTLAISYLFPAFFQSLYPKELEEAFSQLASEGVGYLYLIVGLLGPVMEEIVFRGAILSRLKSWPLGGILLSSLLFALFHLNLYQGSYSFFLGLLLGYVAYRGASLWLPILLHVAYNILSGLFNSLPPETLDFLYIQSFAAPILGGILLAAGLRHFRKNA